MGEARRTLPVALAEDAYDSVGTTESDKQLVVFEGSAHYPFHEETERALEVITSFVEAYR